eukprot:366330-Chlamydomonas_euryale.AAC.4
MDGWMVGWRWGRGREVGPQVWAGVTEEWSGGGGSGVAVVAICHWRNANAWQRYHPSERL